MPAWSSLGGNAFKLISRKLFSQQNLIVRNMSERKMNITSSRFQWHKFKDLLHFYTLLGLIPVGLIVFYANVFIGPAQLAEIPEDYTPKHWEYYSHPITRFLARYVFTPPQQEYEKYLHVLYEEDEKKKIRLLVKDVKEKMKERSDYRAFYVKPFDGKYYRIARESAEENANIAGFSSPKP
ncbi:NADH dehydrogenase [ubiquinone] 1 beta subcomplex subunit 5, mitochondrial [Cimex lectularius]|uniref:NADH dehydrogenase [ubiquinone] 1 beta subcomplex subunit 5, mitochondrial n=1 Tax=Cimex lectularius TaxID=79782 RepID=A0A8I6TJM1_CIMLE|nr:NADH dehydrogenase [ubiquinone] 1 beta subcomplex subunit 5, mitochondrial [Cimex lectularius]XP_014256192.1 NADH dehydrogenase [ubiquinone] 1 beta subcomplex subunit 5, mitochondrial [Cimex lectularius]